MARLFTAASSQYLRRTSSPVAGYPFTLSAWFNTDDNTLPQQTLISIGDVTGTLYYALFLGGFGDTVNAMAYDGDTLSTALSTSSFSLNTWQHACAVFTSNGNISALLEGGSKGTNSDAHGAITADAVAIGVSADSTPYGYMSKAIAEGAIYDIALPDADILLLSLGLSPLFVRPESLVSYWRLIRDEDQDIVGGYDLTAYNGPTITAHPPVLYPAPLHLGHVVAAPSTPMPMARHHDRLRRVA